MKRGFVLHHNGPAANCLDRPHTRCVAYWAAVRSFHMAPEPKGQGWSDIAYSFGVCPHGMRLTGRGWNKNQFANGTDLVGTNDGPDSEWYTVLVFIGIGEAPTEQMVDGVVALIDEGRASGRCASRVLPHNAFKQKACPGPEFTTYAQLWDNRALVAPTQKEDDMTPENLAEIKAAMKAEVASGVKQAAKFLTVGGPTTIFDPKVTGNEWMTGAGTVTLPKLLLATQDVDVDVVELAAVLAPVLAAAVIEALPDEVTDHLDAEEFEALVVSALGSVRLTPDAG